MQVAEGRFCLFRDAARSGKRITTAGWYGEIFSRLKSPRSPDVAWPARCVDIIGCRNSADIDRRTQPCLFELIFHRPAMPEPNARKGFAR